MSEPTALHLFILEWATKKRRCAGLNKVIRIARDLTWVISEWTRWSIHCAVIHALKR